MEGQICCVHIKEMGMIEQGYDKDGTVETQSKKFEGSIEYEQCGLKEWVKLNRHRT